MINRPIPEYSRTMYQDYEPWEVLAAAHKKMLATAAKAAEKPAAAADAEDYTVNITSEVKVKK